MFTKKIYGLIAILTLLMGANMFAGITVTVPYGFTGADQTTMNNYLNQAVPTFEEAFKGTADSYAASNVGQPVFGEPNRYFAVGFINSVTWNKGGFNNNVPGGEILNKTLVDAKLAGEVSPFMVSDTPALFGTLSLGWLIPKSDLSVKLFYVNNFKPADGVETDVFNLGIIFRKQVFEKTRIIPLILSFEGLSWSIGYFQLDNSVHYKDNISFQAPAVNGVQIDVTGTDSKIDIKTKTLDAEVKAYFNLLGFFDIFGGGGLAYNVQNELTIDSTFYGNFTVGGTIDQPSTMTAKGSVDGQKFLPRTMVGIQINIGPVKIPVQYSIVFSKERNYNVFTFGAALSF